jgi:hypothetical protein
LVRLVASEPKADSGVDDQVVQALGSLPVEAPKEGKPGVCVKSLANVLKKSDKTVREALKRLIAAERCLEVGVAPRGLKLYAVNA